MSEEKEIPTGWELPELEEVLDIQGGSQPPKSTFIYKPKEGYIQLLQIRDFGKKPVPTFVLIKKVSKFCKKTDVLIARYGASLGRIVTGREGAYNVALAKVIDDKGLFSNRYLFYLLQTQIFQMPLAMLSRSAQNGFAKHEISHIPLPLPPLPEQHRIVAKIEELFSSLDKGIESLKTAQQQLKTYRQAVLKWAFEGKLTNENVKDGALPEGWKWVELQTITDKITDGEHFRPKTVDEGIPFLSAKDVRDEGISFESPLYISEATAKKTLQRCNPKNGDILIVSRGATVGRMCIVKTDKVFCLLGSVILIKVKDDVNSYFLTYVLKSPAINQKIISVSGATAQQAIYLRDIKNMLLPVPTIREQELIVSEIESRLSVCDNLEESITRSFQQAEALRQSILKKAFEGKLVPQDPNDEPASVLLERIRTLRQAQSTDKPAKDRGREVSSKQKKRTVPKKKTTGRRSKS